MRQAKKRTPREEEEEEEGQRQKKEVGQQRGKGEKSKDGRDKRCRRAGTGR